MSPDGVAADSEFAATVASPLGPPAWADEANPGKDPESEPADPDTDATLGHVGRYALKRKLGEGGLGIVYEAWDPLLSRAVAVKTLQFDVDESARLALDRLFLNEARAVAGLNHPHIVTVFDAGLSAQGVYIAMERLRGRDLRQALAAGWRPTPGVTARLVRRVADALAYAHARGVVHCDIKPGNIFLTRKDRPTVLDFGIARVAHGAAPGTDGSVAGSPYYLAPEQLQGGAVDARTDVYALGVVLYEALTGRKPFAGDSLEQIHSAVLHHPPPPAHDLTPDVPAGLSALVARTMARDPAARPASAAELARQLRRWEPDPGDDDGARPAWKRPLVWGGAAALLCVATAWAVLRQPAPPPAPPLVQSASPPAAATVAIAAEPAASVLAAASAAASSPGATTPATSPTPARRVARATKPKRAAPPPAPVAAVATGSVHLAVTPWGQIEVDGHPAGVTPPLTQLSLPEGRHLVTVRNGDFPAYTLEVQVSADEPVNVRHRFGP